MAIDISYSMDYDELALQRDGYVQALTSQEFLNALKQGTNGKVAVTLVEWAGANDQRVVLPWRLIDGPASARSGRRRNGEGAGAPRLPHLDLRARSLFAARCSRTTASAASAA